MWNYNDFNFKNERDSMMNEFNDNGQLNNQENVPVNGQPDLLNGQFNNQVNNDFQAQEMPNLMGDQNEQVQVNEQPNLLNAQDNQLNQNNVMPDLMNSSNEQVNVQNEQPNVPNGQVSNQQVGVQGRQYAPGGDRIVAFIIDCLLSICVPFFIYIILWIITFIFAVMRIDTGLFSTLVVFVTMLLMLFAYPIKCLLDFKKYGVSKGMKKKGLIILNENGSQITFGQMAARMLLMWLFNNVGGSLISLVLMFCTEKKQTLHDMVLKQVVVKE